MRLAFFVGYANVDPIDDTFYLQLAERFREGTVDEALAEAVQRLNDGTLVVDVRFVLRRGAYIPVGLAQWVLGTSELASALPSLLAWRDRASLCGARPSTPSCPSTWSSPPGSWPTFPSPFSSPLPFFSASKQRGPPARVARGSCSSG